jgi:hypothetical protein
MSLYTFRLSADVSHLGVASAPQLTELHASAHLVVAIYKGRFVPGQQKAAALNQGDGGCG